MNEKEIRTERNELKEYLEALQANMHQMGLKFGQLARESQRQGLPQHHTPLAISKGLLMAAEKAVEEANKVLGYNMLAVAERVEGTAPDDFMGDPIGDDDDDLHIL